MKRRATSILFAVVTSGTAVVAADPSPQSPQPTPAVDQPRKLATGAPACGNVMFKTYVQPPPCTTTAQTVFTAIIEEAAQIRRALAAFDVWADRPVTVAEARRPRS